MIVLAIATAMDIRGRRIPNWLVLPFLAMGLVASAAGYSAVPLPQSIAGAALAITFGGVLCWLRGMGLGDLKLFASLGAWIGPEQLVFAFIATGIAGGFLALLWAIHHRRLAECLTSTGDLLGSWKTGIRPHATIRLDRPGTLKMPYAPAIAIGTIFSFFG